MGNTFFFDWEVRLMEWIQAHAGRVGQALAVFFTMFGEELVMVAVAGLLYWCINKTWGKRVITTLLLGTTVNTWVKNIFMRRRPYMDHPSIQCLRPVHDGDVTDSLVQGFSFPSGHSTDSVGCYLSTALCFRKKRFFVCGCILALLIGVSRVVLGVHYPTDVLGGWALGLLILALVTLLERYVSREWVRSLILLAVGLPGIFFSHSEDYFTSYGMLIGFCAGIWFEGRFVKFQNTRNVFDMILRMAVGVGIFLGLNELLKLPFPSAFLASDTMAAHLVRLCRYAVDIFVIIGPYTLLFRFSARLFGRKKKNAA